jgi:hypothetical protein
MLLLDRNRAVRDGLGKMAKDRTRALIRNQNPDEIFDFYQSVINSPKRNQSSILKRLIL